MDRILQACCKAERFGNSNDISTHISDTFSSIHEARTCNFPDQLTRFRTSRNTRWTSRTFETYVISRSNTHTHTHTHAHRYDKHLVRKFSCLEKKNIFGCYTGVCLLSNFMSGRTCRDVLPLLLARSVKSMRYLSINTSWLRGRWISVKRKCSSTRYDDSNTITFLLLL